MNFTVLLPFLGTDKEQKFAQQSIPSIVSLEPNELIFGVDDNTHDEFITKLCKKHNFDKFIIQYVPKSNDWNMQLANVVWNMMDKAVNEKILLTNIDDVLLPKVMEGYEYLNDPNAIFYTGHAKPYTVTTSDKVRLLFAIITLKITKKGGSGVYFLRKSSFFKFTLKKQYQNIHNSMDAAFIEEFKRVSTSDKNKIWLSPSTICNSLDYSNDFLPWRLFMLGIWIYSRLNLEEVNTTFIRRLLRKRFPFLLMLRVAFLYQSRYIIEGYRWASKNKDNKIVKLAHGVSYIEYGYHGGNMVKHLKDWESIGKTGTGY